jgi:LmeA-like phospholipid-binding
VRRLLIALAILVVLLVGADFVLRAVAEHAVATELQKSLQLSARPSVSLGGFPFLLHLAEGRFPSASAQAKGLDAGDLAFASVDLSFRDLRASTGSLFAGRSTDVRARSGSGSATMTGAEATAALHARGIDGTVRFVGRQVRVRSSQLPREIRATLSLFGRDLLVRSADPAFPGSFSIALPQLIEGARFTGVTVEDSVAVLRFQLDHPVFRIS